MSEGEVLINSVAGYYQKQSKTGDCFKSNTIINMSDDSLLDQNIELINDEIFTVDENVQLILPGEADFVVNNNAMSVDNDGDPRNVEQGKQQKLFDMFKAKSKSKQRYVSKSKFRRKLSRMLDFFKFR